MSSSSISTGGRSDYLEQLAAIREDPKVKKLARARAGDPELAEDALQEGYYAVARMVARMENPERIVDLRAYYCRVLLRSIHKLRSQLGADLIDDLIRTVPGRSPDPALYREMIDTAAERLLLASDAGGLSEAEQYLALRTLYPQWFDEAVVPVNNVHQRFIRARADVDRLLQGFIKRGDFYS